MYGNGCEVDRGVGAKQEGSIMIVRCHVGMLNSLYLFVTHNSALYTIVNIRSESAKGTKAFISGMSAKVHPD